jgi:hypothetical protein
MKRMILVAAVLLATASSPAAFASDKDGDTGGKDLQTTSTEKKGAEPEHVGGGRGEPQRAQEQRCECEEAALQKDELTSRQREVLADWRAVEQLQQRVP